MNSNDTAALVVKAPLLPPEQAFEWPRQAMLLRSWQDAARRWAVLRKVYPQHPPTWIQGAAAHIEEGEFEQAEALLSHARRYFPNNPNALANSAELAIRRQDWCKAEDFLAEARDRFPDDFQSWTKSADCAEIQGDTEQALRYNREARHRAPGRPAPFVQYAEMAMRAKQWEQALERWEDVRTRFPNIPAGYVRAAEAARQLDRMKEAQKLIATQRYGPAIFKAAQHEPDVTIGHKGPMLLWQFLELIWVKAIFNLRSEVQRNYLSYLWWVLEPLLHMTVYYLVFGLLLKRGGADYPVFLLTGLIPWLWFTKAVTGSSNSILVNQNLILKVKLPVIAFPLISLLQASIKQVPVFLLLFGFVWLQGYGPGNHWWSLVPVIMFQALLTVLCSCAVAATIPFARDLGYLVPTSLMFVMFISGVFFDYRVVPQEIQDLFLLNPIAFLLKCYRDIFIYGEVPDITILAWWGMGILTACLILFKVYKGLSYVYPRIVVE